MGVQKTVAGTGWDAEKQGNCPQVQLTKAGRLPAILNAELPS